MAFLVKKLFVLFLVCHDYRQIVTNHCDSFQPKVENLSGTRNSHQRFIVNGESRQFLNWSIVGLRQRLGAN
ncbi:MAG TPA: hypothetical protein VFQ36_16705 [Ktedonobacteraceae bacterium]|nr:hypothetical protein [Ktedonobacteraceae bacterium]